MADPRILALEITGDSAGGILFSEGKQGPEVKAAHFCPITAEVPLEEALAEVVEKCGASLSRCFLAMGAEQFYFRSLHVPFTDSKKVRSVIPFEIEDNVSFQDQPFLFDYLLEPAAEKGTDVFAVLVEKSTIETLLTLLKDNGLDPALITVSGLPSVFNICRYHEEKRAAFALLQIDSRRATLFVVVNNEIKAIRSLAYRQSAEAGLGEAAKAETTPTDDPHQLEKALGRLAVDVHYALVATQSSLPDDSPISIAFGGTVGSLPQAREIMLRKLDASEWDADWVSFAEFKNLGAISEQFLRGSLANALDLACCSPKDRERINFRKDEFAFTGKQLKFSRMLKAAAIAFVLLVGAAAVYQAVDFRNKEQQRTMLSEQIEALYRETIPDANPGPDPVKELQVKVRDLDEASATGTVLDPSINTVKLLAEISAQLPVSMEVSFERLIYDRRIISIKGLTDNFNTVDLMKSALAKSPYFSDVTIGSANMAPKGEGIRFELKLYL